MTTPASIEGPTGQVVLTGRGFRFELRRTNPKMSAQRIPMAKAVLLHLGAITVAVALLVGAMATAAGANAASDEAQAKSHLLVLSDMPNGWSAEKGTAGSGSSGDFTGLGFAGLAACIGVPISVFSSNPPYANSPYYDNQPQSLEVQDTVSVFPSVTDAQAQVTAIASAKTPGCTTAFMNSPAAKSQIEKEAGLGKGGPSARSQSPPSTPRCTARTLRASP